MQKIVPFLWFNDDAEEAATFYTSIFKNAKIDNVSRYGDAGPLPAGTAMVVEFELAGQEFMALNGGNSHAGSPAIALFVNCDDQAEVDSLWAQLSEGGKTGQCGWLTDRYGFSWNIVPANLSDLIGGADSAGAQRAMASMLQMEKLDIDVLRRAYDES